MQYFHSKFEEKFKETLKAVLPILAIVLLLCFTIAPIPPSILISFLIGAVLLIMGMLLFNVGVELSMTPIGERVGSILIMEAARSAGAHGGTVIHAKGTGMQAADKFMGVSLAIEKEMVFIVAKTEEKNSIMQAVMDTAGLRLVEDDND